MLPGVAPLRLLALVAASGPQPIARLMAESGLEFTAFSDVLKTMREAGLITLVGQPGHEVVDLTPDGARLAQLAR
jgi:predicted transcriptional regulator